MEDQKKAVYSLVQGEAGEAWARRMFSGWDMTSKGKSMPWTMDRSLSLSKYPTQDFGLQRTSTRAAFEIIST